MYAEMKGPLLMPYRPRLFRRARYHQTCRRSDTGDSGVKCLDVTKVEQIGADQGTQHSRDKGDFWRIRSQQISLPSIASAKNAGEGTTCALRDFIDDSILHEWRISESIESVARRISHGKQPVYSLCDRHLYSERRFPAGWLFSSSPEDLAAATWWHDV